MAFLVAERCCPSAFGISEGPLGQHRLPGTLEKTEAVARAHFLTVEDCNALFRAFPCYVKNRSFYRIASGGAQGDNFRSFAYAFDDVGGLARFIPGLSPPSTAMLGMTSVNSIATGATTVGKGHHQVQAGSRCGDSVARTAGVLNVFRGILEAISGTIFTSFRVLSLIPSTTAATLAAIGTTGVIGYVGVYLLMTGAFGAAAHDIRMFWQKLDDAKKMGPKEAHTFLFESVVLHENEVNSALDSVAKNPEYGLDYEDQKEYIKAYKAMRLNTLDVADIPDELKEKLKTLQKCIPEDTWTRLETKLRFESEPKHRETNVANVLDSLFKHMERRHSQAGRAIGQTVLTKLLNHGKQPPEKIMKEIVDLAEEKTSKHFWLYVFLASTCVFGAATFALSLVFTGGIPYVGIAVAMLITGLLMTGIDGYFLLEGLNNSRPKNWENIAMWLLSIGFVSAAVISTFLSAGVVPIVVLSTVAILWTALFIYTQMMWAKPHEQKERIDKSFRSGAPAAPAPAGL